MKAQDVTKGMTIKGNGVVTAVHHGYNTMFFILKGGAQVSYGKNELLATLPARDAKGRFMARVVVVLSYCEELGDIVTTHVGMKSARLAVSLHKAIWPNGHSVVA